MVTVTHFGEAPFALYHSSVGGNLEIFKEQSTTHRRHEFQNSARPATATRPPRTPRSSLIGFVAVSAVVFLAYLCAVSIGKRIAAPPFSRRLAASLGGGECDVPEDSRSAGSATDTPFEGRPAVTADLHAVVEALGAHPEDTGPDSLTGTIAAAPWRTISRTANPQQEVQRRQPHLSGRGKEQRKQEKEAKPVKFTPVGNETQLQSTPPPLDPDIEALIESVLSGVEDAFVEDVWLPGDELVDREADNSTGRMPPPLEYDPELPSEALTLTEETVYVLPSKPSALPCDSEGPKTPAYRGEERRRECFKRKQEEQHKAVKDSVSYRQGLKLCAVDLPAIQQSWAAPGVVYVNVVIQQAIEETPQALTAYAFGAPEEKKPGSSEESVADTWPSSSRVSPALPQLPLEATFSQQSDSTEQPEYGAELPTDENANLHFREIMKQPSLSREDFEDLLTQAECLCGYATGGMPATSRGGQARQAVETQGLIFIVFDALHCAAEVLGDKSMKQLWWPLIVRHIRDAKFVPKKGLILPEKALRNSVVARRLHVALEYYRRGLRPPMRMVIGLKEALFCELGAGSKFSAAQWNPWRKDAAQWRQSIQPSPAVGK
ncbi:hypothetical protein EBH_0049750 [Eimeria brunetti]|uniref:Transmembrane protein n=1 Tax=Eimeria brunetti TaxID=51314 RepID=U6LV41_9EIME|nr:hypothetical protein EBH_0049750 [Eimeria brunetti]